MTEKNDETSMEHNEKQDLEQSGTETEQNETIMENNVEQDLGTDETLLSDAVSMRQEGKTYREIESKTKIPKATLYRHLKNVVPKTQTINPQREIPESNLNNSHDTEEIPEPQQFPGGSVLLEPSDVEAIRNMVPKTHQSTYIAHIDLASKRRSQINRNNGHNNDGHEQPLSQREMLSYLQTQDLIDTIKRKRDNNTESESLREIKQEIRELRQSREHNASPLETTKLVFEAFSKGMEYASPKAQTDPTSLVWKAVETVEKIQERVSNPSQRNEFDLKLEEMRGSREIDNRKIDHEERVWEHQVASEGKTLETITDTAKAILSGPVGEAIKTFGAGAADRVRGAPKMPSVDVQCPNCRNRWKANPDLDLLHCPNCGAGLQKRAQPTEPEPQTEATQPSSTEQTEQPEVQEQKPELDRWTPEQREAYRNGEKTDEPRGIALPGGE